MQEMNGRRRVIGFIVGERLLSSALKAVGMAILSALLAVRSMAGAEGLIKIDGSSTVYPISEAVAEEYGKKAPHVKVTVGISGTGGGFEKFCAGETHIANASRPIKSTEVERCRKNGVEYIELPIAYDALTVVVNRGNTWAEAMTVAELKKLWAPEAQGKITRWSEIRNGWPDRPITLYGAGVDSGTYDYFTEAIVGREDSSRGDFTSSEDDNTLVQGVAGDIGALGFFGYAYFVENREKLKAVAIDDGIETNGRGPQLPSPETVINGTYQPLSRPLFIYVRKSALDDSPEVKQFVEFYVNEVGKLSAEVGYVQLPEEVYRLALKRLEGKKIGSIFAAGGSQVGITLADLLKREQG